MKFASSILAVGIVAVGQTSATPYPPPVGGVVIKPIKQIELGPRPYFLVDDMDEGPLKTKLASCKDKNMKASSWSYGHRGGAPLQFPEHTRQSNLAGARMGAGVLECDVAFTKDRKLVCRHSQCDLHTTTNIVTIPELNAKCTTPFVPAANGKPATAKCCTSDFTVAEFKTLCGKMDAFNATATTAQDYLGGTASWRTDLYATCGTVMTLKEHIELGDGLGLDFTPELKTPEVKMPFQGTYTQAHYAQQLINEFKAAGIHPSRVLPQSFLYDDILYWIKAEPKFGRQAVYLDQNGETAQTFPGAVANLTQYKADGVRIVAPPLPYLVHVLDGKMVPSPYAKRANELGLKIVTWSLERSPPLAVVHKKGDYYWSSVKDVVKKDGDMYKLVDVLHRQIGVKAVFSDWSATVTYYANCFNIGLRK